MLGTGSDLLVLHGVMLARAGRGVTGEQRPDDHGRLLEPTDSPSRSLERESCPHVLGGDVAGAEAELEPPAGQVGQRSRLAGQHHGVAKVVVEHEGADMYAFGRLDEHRACGQRGGHPIGQMVRDRQGAVSR